jgi:phospholipase/carboxylesterase
VRRLLPLLAISLALRACQRDHRPPAGETPAPVSSAPAEPSGVRYLERVTGGASPSDTLPLILGIHGFGGSPEDFGGVLTGFSAPARVILPYGTIPIRSGHAWFTLPDPSRPEPAGAGVRRAADRLAALLAEIVRTRPTAGKPIVVGFSQGGMLSYAMAALHPEAVGAAFPLGGLLQPDLWPAAWPPGQPKIPIRAFHGDSDPRVSIDDDRATARHLRDIGLPVELVEYPGVGHSVPREMRRDLLPALEQAAREAASGAGRGR